MSNKSYFIVTSLIFLLMALIHLWRLVGGWEAVFNGYNLPMWVSWFGLVVAGFLAYRGFKGYRN